MNPHDPPGAGRKPEETGGRRPAGRGAARELVAAALARGEKQEDAAAQGKVSARTVRNWLAEPAFSTRVAEIRGELVKAAAGRLVDGMAEAADVLRKLLKNRDPHVRYKSARAIIELGVKCQELAELQARVEEIESRLASEKNCQGSRP